MKKRENMKTYFRTEEPGYESLAATVAASMVDEYRNLYKKYKKTSEEDLVEELNKLRFDFAGHFCWTTTTDMDFDDVADLIEMQEDRK